MYPDLVTIDGVKLGKMVSVSPPDPTGHINVTLLKHSYLESYYVRDTRKAVTLVKRLLEKRGLDPRNTDVLIALVRKEYDEVSIPSDAILLPKGVQNYNAVPVLMDRKGNPLPLKAILSDSAKERNSLARLYRYYSGIVHYVYPKMVRELDLYRSLVKEMQTLLNIRDFEVDSLLDANRKLQTVVKTSYATILDLAGQVRLLEQNLLLSLKESEHWRKAAQDAIETLPTISKLLNSLAEQLSRSMTLTMQRHVAEMSRSEVVERTINELLTKIKELEQKHLENIQKAVKKEVSSEEKPEKPAEVVEETPEEEVTEE